MKYCVPLVIYLVLTGLSLVSYILSGRILETPGNTVSHIVVAGITAGLLYWLCSIGYTKTAWVVLLFPVIVITLILLTFITAVGSIRTSARIGAGNVSANVRSRLVASQN